MLRRLFVAVILSIAIFGAITSGIRVDEADLDDFDPDEFIVPTATGSGGEGERFIGVDADTHSGGGPAAAAAAAAKGRDSFDVDDEDEFEFDEHELVAEADEAARAARESNLRHTSNTGGTNPLNKVQDPLTGALRRRRFPEDFSEEIVFGVFVVLYAAFFVWGMSTNSDLAHRFHEQIVELLEAQFAQVGNTGKSELTKLSQSEYEIVCSGRDNCIGTVITAKLKPRHDLVQSLYGLVAPYSDRVVIHVPIETGTAPPVMLAIIPKKDEKSFREDNEIIGRLKSRGTVGENHRLIADVRELSDTFVDTRVRAMVDSKYFDSLVISDHYNLSKDFKNILILKVKLPTTRDDMGEVARLCTRAFWLADKLAALSLSSKGQAESLKVRKVIMKEQREADREKIEEELLKKKKEKADAEEERIKNLPPEARRKAEEKMARREQKKKRGRSGRVQFVR